MYNYLFKLFRSLCFTQSPPANSSSPTSADQIERCEQNIRSTDSIVLKKKENNNQSIISATDGIQFTLTLKMTTAQVVETSFTVNNNSPIQDYVHPDDQTQPTFEGEFNWKRDRMGDKSSVNLVSRSRRCLLVVLVVLD